jgi:transposase InsO family protein
VIFTYNGDAERARVTGLRGARRLLSRAALDDDSIHRAVGELDREHATVLVDLHEIAASDAWAQLEPAARAA